MGARNLSGPLRGNCAAAALVAMLWLGAPTRAFGGDEARRAEARELAERAQDHLERGEHAAALPLLERADGLYHAPTLTLLRARALAGLGRWAEAAEAYDAVAAEQLAPDAPAPWRDAVRLAGEERRDAHAKVGTLRLEVGPHGIAATARIDGRPPRAATGSFLVDGDRSAQLVVAAPGHATVTRTVVVPAGRAVGLHLDLHPLGAAGYAAPATSTAPTTGEPPAAGSSSILGTPWPTVAGATVTGIALVVGTALGVAALDAAADLEASCGGIACPNRNEANAAELAALQEDGRSLADASTAGFVVAGIAAAATTVLIVLWSLDGGDGDAESGTSAVVMTAEGSPGWLGVRGRF